MLRRERERQLIFLGLSAPTLLLQHQRLDLEQSPPCRLVQVAVRLPPTRELTLILEYALAYAAQQTGVLLHEFFVISNHDHEVFTDPEARAPEFWQIFHALAARAINAHFDEGDRTGMLV